jgi:hypothetical protein
MAFSRLGWFVCLAVAPLYGGTVDVSSLTSVTLNDGDSLTFAISAWSYKVHAAALGDPASPSDLSFSLLTDPLLAALDLSVSLESYGGAVSVAVGDASQPAYLEGSLYQGPVSDEYGSLPLSPDLSSQIFAGPAVLLVFEDVGGEVTLGLSPYTLLQSLEVNLSGGALSVGGVVAAVTLRQAPPLLADDSLNAAVGAQMSVMTDEFDDSDPTGVPEPSSSALLALGGLCLVLLAHFSKRRRKLPM